MLSDQLCGKRLQLWLAAGDEDQGHAAGGELPGKITAYARRRSGNQRCFSGIIKRIHMFNPVSLMYAAQHKPCT